MLPVYEIIDYRENRYILAIASIKRARQINFSGDEKLEEFNGKIASLSLKQILNKEINFFLPKEKGKR